MDKKMIKNLKKNLLDAATERKAPVGRPPQRPLNIGFGLGSHIPETHSPSDSTQFISPGSSAGTYGMGSGGPSDTANSFDSLGRQSSRTSLTTPPSSPVTKIFNPLFGTHSSFQNEITEDDQPPSPIFQTAEVHHREPLTVPLSPSRRSWGACPDTLDVEPVSVTIIGPDGHPSVYRPSREGSGRATVQGLIAALRKFWPASALTQIPGWFEQWWNKGSARPARPKTESTWALIRAGKFDCIELDAAAKLQIAAFLLLVFLVVFLAYMLYDNWVQSRKEVTIFPSGAGNPRDRVTYMTKDQFRREQHRRKREERHIEPFSVDTPPAPNYTPVYEYPPRRVTYDRRRLK